MKKNTNRALLLALAVLVWACASDADGDKNLDGGGSIEIEVAGTWTDQFGTVLTVTATDWNGKGKDFESKAKIVAHNNAANWAITQSSADDKYSANKFSKQVWTEPKTGVFHHCTVVYGIDSVDLVKASTETADATDLKGKGCGGFPWTRLTDK